MTKVPKNIDYWKRLGAPTQTRSKYVEPSEPVERRRVYGKVKNADYFKRMAAAQKTTQKYKRPDGDDGRNKQ
jgi:hypothetical protein